MTGQDAVATATAFHETLALDGVILTKLDGDARGGAALSVKEVVGRPIAFASTGERLGDFDLFHPDRMADRILGMGDVLSLIEQAERTMDREIVAQLGRPDDGGPVHPRRLLGAAAAGPKLGSLGGIMKLLPGMSKEMRQAADQIDDREVSRVEAIVRSMTPRGAGRPVGHRRLTPGPHRPGERDHHPGRQPAAEAVPGDAEDDAGHGPGWGMPDLGGAMAGPMGKLGGLLGGRKALANLSALGEAGPGGDAELTRLLSQSGAPPMDFAAGGGRWPAGRWRGAAPRPEPGAARRRRRAVG